MDEQTTHSEDELNLATSGDEVADTEQSDTDNSDEQEQDTLNLEDSEVTPKQQEKGKAETAREKLVSDWVKNVKAEKKTLNDIPKDQAWLRPLVEAKLDVKAESSIDAVRQVLAEEREEEKFNSHKAELEEMSLDKDKKAALEGKFKAYRLKGLSKLDALETAMEVLGIDPREAQLDAKRHAMRLRTPGNYRKANDSDPSSLHEQAGYGEVAKTLSPEKRIEYLKSLRK